MKKEVEEIAEYMLGHGDMDADEEDSSVIWKDNDAKMQRILDITMYAGITALLLILTTGSLAAGSIITSVVLLLLTSFSIYIIYEKCNTYRTIVTILQKGLKIGDKTYKTENIKKIEYLTGRALSYQKGIWVRNFSTGHTYRVRLKSGIWKYFTISDKQNFDEAIEQIIHTDNLEENEFGLKHLDQQQVMFWVRYIARGAYYGVGAIVLIAITSAIGYKYIINGHFDSGLFTTAVIFGFVLSVPSVR